MTIGLSPGRGLTDDELRATPVPVTVGAGSPPALNNGTEVAVTNVAVQIIAANLTRRALFIQNTGNKPVRIGSTGVTATTGILLDKEATMMFAGDSCPVQAIFAIRAGGANSTVIAVELA